MRSFVLRCSTLALLLGLASCEVPGDPTQPTDGPLFARSANPASALEAAVTALGDDVNEALRSAGSEFEVSTIEYLTAGEEIGRSVFFGNVGNKRLPEDFVAGDPRRDWSGAGDGDGDDITWASDLVQGDAGVGAGATQTAIASAMGTWDGVTCSMLPLTQLNAPGNLGVIEASIFGVDVDPAADVVHAGFGSILDLFLPPPIIAATFTFWWVDSATRIPTDIDNDRRLDVAFREIYYTNNFPWSLGGPGDIDIETVVLHETGHGLSQAHFGQLFETDRNGRFHFSPRAVMNAGYTGPQRSIGDSDNAGHCSNWASWPSN